MLPNYILIAPEDIRALGYASIGTSYVNLGTALSDAALMIKITNTTDKDVYISWFNQDDHMIIPTGQPPVIYNIATNKGTGGTLVIPQNTQFQVRSASTAPGSGAVYLEAYHASNNGQ